MSAPNANSDNADRAAKIIRDALGIEFDDVVNYCFRRTGRPTASGDGTPASSYAMTGRYWPASNARKCYEWRSSADEVLE
jgi:hypothetical protein